jgi:hypothetical protein
VTKKVSKSLSDELNWLFLAAQRYSLDSAILCKEEDLVEIERNLEEVGGVYIGTQTRFILRQESIEMIHRWSAYSHGSLEPLLMSSEASLLNRHI